MEWCNAGFITTGGCRRQNWCCTRNRPSTCTVSSTARPRENGTLIRSRPEIDFPAASGRLGTRGSLVFVDQIAVRQFETPVVATGVEPFKAHLIFTGSEKR